MAFKDYVNTDLSVFFNTGEFSDSVTIDGQQVNVVIDDDRLKKRSAEYGGVSTGMILYFVPVAAFSSRPQIGSTQIFNNRMYWVDDVSETAGVYEIVLNQNRGE
ncbi:hypothetical protein [Ferviditalea candida]|uniref:Phage protein n=1 Tax=Ferviditalea candida TaxID=3108399 RepID=A0ABU5ZPD7_9BACL|nr:hypothetical protein [Paenibacillaceae bacterium T2]